MNTFTFTYISQDVAAGATTTLNIKAIGEVVLKTGDVIAVIDNKTGITTEFVLNADQGASDTTLTVVSKVTTSKIHFGAIINISYTNLSVQYQRKTEGTIGGMPVTADTLGPITYAGGTYSITGFDSTYIKILPRDFMVNEDVSPAPALEFKDASNTGLQVGDGGQDMIATVNIPSGTTATEVYVWASIASKVFEVYEGEVDTNGIGSNRIASGRTDGTAYAITVPIAATATNYLIIKVKVTATSNRIYGGKVTLTQN